MIILADHILAKMLNVHIDEVRALKQVCRDSHPKGGGIRLGHCVCGRPGPPSPACVALGALVNVADLINLETRP